MYCIILWEWDRICPPDFTVLHLFFIKQGLLFGQTIIKIYWCESLLLFSKVIIHRSVPLKTGNEL